MPVNWRSIASIARHRDIAVIGKNLLPLMNADKR